jgi:hypothetical protein
MLKNWFQQIFIQVIYDQWIKPYLPDLAGLAVSGLGWVFADEATPLWVYGLYVIGGILISLLFRDLRSRRQSLAPSAEEKHSIEFFATANELEDRYPGSKTFKPGNKIYAYFLTGEGVFSPHSDRIERFGRLILPKPDCAYITLLNTLMPSGLNPYVNFQPQIMVTTAIAKKEEVRRQQQIGHSDPLVKWFDDFIGFSLLFCNPDQDNGFVHITNVVPFLKSKWQPTFRLERCKNKQLFDDLFEAFQGIAKASN